MNKLENAQIDFNNFVEERVSCIVSNNLSNYDIKIQEKYKGELINLFHMYF